MIISTHSPIILAGSRQNPETKKWVLIDRYEVRADHSVDGVSASDIENIGRVMGDANFDAYFTGGGQGPFVLIEDARNLTRTSFENAGIRVTKSLSGISDVKKYLGVYLGVSEALSDNAYFIVDGDKGLNEVNSLLAEGTVVGEQTGWTKYKLKDRLFVVVLPVGTAVESLFDEWPNVLEETIDDLLDVDLSIKPSIPARLSRVVDPLRRNPPIDRQDAIAKICSMQDVKDRFWQRVAESGWNISDQHAMALKALLND